MMTAMPLYQQENVQVNDVPPMKSMSEAKLDRQCKLAAESDSKDVSLQEFMDDAFEIIDDWTA